MIDPQGPEATPAPSNSGHLDALTVGTRLAEFEIQGLLGVGGFGMVYCGYDHSLQRAVAIKEYMPSTLVNRGTDLHLVPRSEADAQSFQSGLNSFISEARLLARFDHPSLVKVYRFWEANHTAYMAMPLYKGITLKQARKQMSGPPPEDWLRVVVWSVLEALKVLHASDALHRDVSPDNIFLQDIGPPVLLDLGAARMAVIEGQKKHTAILKVNYAPIEQYADARDMREGPWTDVYALASVIHGCICNEAPLPATLRVVRDRLPSMAKIAKTTESHFGQSYSSSFIKAIDRALAIQPGDRPQTVDAFARTMKLRSVSHPQRFNWRASLGEKVSLSTGPQGAKSAVFGASALVDETVPFERKPVKLAPQAPPPQTIDLSDGTLREKNRRRLLVGGAGALAGIVALWVGVTYTGQLRDLPRSATKQVVATAEVPVVPEPPSSSPSVVQSVPAEESLPPKLTAPASALRPSKPSPAAPARSKPGEAQKAVVNPAPESRADTLLAEEAMSPNPASSQAVAKRESIVLCAESNLFTRPMCIYRECQKAEYAGLQVCIDDKKRWEERDRARLQ